MDRLISEQAVLETIATWVKTSEPYDRNGWLTPRYLYDRIKTIPTAEPYEGMTNGEVLEAVFPNIDFGIQEFDGSMWVAMEDIAAFTLDWWNSPYEPQESEG